MKYKVFDCLRGEYLDPDRNWIEDIEDGWHIHMEDAAGLTGKRIAVGITPINEEEVIEDLVEVEFVKGYIDCDIYLKDYMPEGILFGTPLGTLSGVAVGYEAKRPGIGALIRALLTGASGETIGKLTQRWKVRYQ